MTSWMAIIFVCAAYLRSVPHNRGSGVAKFVPARPFIVMPEENVTLQLQNPHVETRKTPEKVLWILERDSHPGSADSTNRRCVCNSCTAFVHSPGSARYRCHTSGTVWWATQSRCCSLKETQEMSNTTMWVGESLEEQVMEVSWVCQLWDLYLVAQCRVSAHVVRYFAGRRYDGGILSMQ